LSRHARTGPERHELLLLLLLSLGTCLLISGGLSGRDGVILGVDIQI